MTAGRYVLQFPTFTEFDYVMSLADRDGMISASPVFTWLDYGKLKESPTVAPEYSIVSVEPSGRNRVLDEVFVSPIPQTAYAVTLATAATATISNSAVYSGTSSDTTKATVSVANGVATITAVASGSATITIEDINNNVISIVSVTVS